MFFFSMLFRVIRVLTITSGFAIGWFSLELFRALFDSYYIFSPLFVIKFIIGLSITFIIAFFEVSRRAVGRRPRATSQEKSDET
jgi:F0F1-type ATP synthase assembly protein I